MTINTDELNSDNPEVGGLPGVMDWSVLDSLKVLQKPGRPDIGRMLITTFLSALPPLMESTRAAVIISDGVALRNTAHSMKSSSTAIGAVVFGKTCAELEFLGKSNTLDEAPALLQRAEYELAETCAELRRAVGV
jgi:HPt (histidine-containing phosphotransfer) domain-containing protein